MNTVTEALVADWGDLAERVGAAPFLWPGWSLAWQRAFETRPLQAATVYQGDRLAAILPLRAHGRALTSPTNAHSPVFGVLAEDEQAAQELLGTLLRTRPRRIDVEHVDPQASDIGLWTAAASASGYRLRAAPQIHSRSLDVSGTWESFERRLRPGRRAELRRRRRRLEERGEVTVEIVRGGERLEYALADGFTLEAGGWKGERGSAILSHPATRRFYTELAHWAADRGWLRLTFLRVGQRAVAFDYILEAGERLYKLKTGYDPEYRAYGPGMLLLHEIVRAAFAGDARTFEFLGGTEPWKLEWGDQVRPLMRLQLFSPSLAGELERATYTYGSVVKRRAIVLARAMRQRGSAPAPAHTKAPEAGPVRQDRLC